MDPVLVAVQIVLGAVVVVVVVVAIVVSYNRFVRQRQLIKNSWANVDTELRRRYDLIPNLVEAVKGYATHERVLFEEVTRARAQAQANTGPPGDQSRDENVLVRDIRQLLAVAERYPDLKASEQFLALQRELANTEDRIQAARRFFNGNVRDYNTRVEAVPSNMIAGMFGFSPEQYFEIEEAIQRDPPRVDMGS